MITWDSKLHLLFLKIRNVLKVYKGPSWRTDLSSLLQAQSCRQEIRHCLMGPQGDQGLQMGTRVVLNKKASRMIISLIFFWVILNYYNPNYVFNIILIIVYSELSVFCIERFLGYLLHFQKFSELSIDKQNGREWGEGREEKRYSTKE